GPRDAVLARGFARHRQSARRVGLRPGIPPGHGRREPSASGFNRDAGGRACGRLTYEARRLARPRPLSSPPESKAATDRGERDERDESGRNADEEIAAKHEIDDERERTRDEALRQRGRRERAGGQENDAGGESGDHRVGDTTGPREKRAVHAHPAGDQHPEAAPQIGADAARDDEERELNHVASSG